MQQSRGKNQYVHFYLPPSGLFDCSVTPKGSAVLRGRSRHPFISVSSFEYVSEVEGQRRKEQKRQEENLLMESSGKIREEVNSNESLGGTAGSLGWKKIDSTTGGEMRNMVSNREEENKRLFLPLPTHLAFVLRAVAQMNHRSWMSFSGSVKTKIWS